MGLPRPDDRRPRCPAPRRLRPLRPPRRARRNPVPLLLTVPDLPCAPDRPTGKAPWVVFISFSRLLALTGWRMIEAWVDRAIDSETARPDLHLPSVASCSRSPRDDLRQRNQT